MSHGKATFARFTVQLSPINHFLRLRGYDRCGTNANMKRAFLAANSVLSHHTVNGNS